MMRQVSEDTGIGTTPRWEGRRFPGNEELRRDPVLSAAWGRTQMMSASLQPRRCRRFALQRRNLQVCNKLRLCRTNPGMVTRRTSGRYGADATTRARPTGKAMVASPKHVDVLSTWRPH